MQQRASICRAMLLSPPLILMDEPFGALDVITRETMGFALQTLWSESRNTVLFVTHSITEAVLLSDTVVVMTPRPGRIRDIIPVDLPRPRDKSTRCATGASPPFRRGARRDRGAVSLGAGKLAALLRSVLGIAMPLAAWQFGAPLARHPGLRAALAEQHCPALRGDVRRAGPGPRHHRLHHAGRSRFGLVVGVLLALLVIYIPLLRSMIMPALAAFNSIPKIAIAPLFVIWFGLGYESKVLLAFLLALFPVFVNSLTGLGEIESDLIDLSTLAGGTPWRVFLEVRLMNALPFITDALKVAFPLALVGSIVGEFIGGNDGIGHLILSGQFNLDTPLVFAALLSITIFTTAGIGAIALFERAALTWRPSRRKR